MLARPLTEGQFSVGHDVGGDVRVMVFEDLGMRYAFDHGSRV